MGSGATTSEVGPIGDFPNGPLVEAIARRVAELLRDDSPLLLDPNDVARRVGRSRAWVYEHASELGVIRLGDGPRPRLAFEPAKVTEFLDACSQGRRTNGPEKGQTKRRTRRSPRRPLPKASDLLPIKGVKP